MPLAIDTNVLLRVLVEDGTEQTARAKARFVASEIFVPASVLLETEWVLRSHLGLDRKGVNGLLSLLVRAPNTTVEAPERIFAAIEAHAKGFDFADALHLFAASDCEALCSFDKDFRRRANRLPNAVSVIDP